MKDILSITAKIHLVRNILILLEFLEYKVIISIYYHILLKSRINKPAFWGPHDMHSDKHVYFYKDLSDQTIWTSMLLKKCDINTVFQYQNNKKMTCILRTLKICDPTLPLILRYMKTETKDTNTWEEFLQTLNCN